MGTGVTRFRREEDEKKTKFLSETARLSAGFARANRAPGMDDEKIHLFEDFTLDLARGCLLRANERVHLRPQSYEVLRHLAENSGRAQALNEAVRRGLVEPMAP